MIRSVDDAFVQTIKDMFGGEGNKKNLVDPFLEARFAGKKVLNSVSLAAALHIGSSFLSQQLMCGFSASAALYSDN